MKKFVLMVSIILGCIALIGCGGTTTTSEKDTTTTSEKDTTTTSEKDTTTTSEKDTTTTSEKDTTTTTTTTTAEVTSIFSLTNIIYDNYNSDNIFLHEGETISSTSTSLGRFHTIVLTGEGRVFTWGSNGFGQLGDVTSSSINTKPIDITSQFDLTDDEVVISVAINSHFSAALTSQGRVFMWGYNSSGQLGNGEQTGESANPTPFDITSKFNLNVDEKIIEISLGVHHAAALTSEGRMFTWGSNSSGQLGDGTNTTSSLPVEITMNIPLNTGERISKISLGGNHSTILTSDNRVFIWGNNSYGEFGNGTILNSTSPIDITTEFSLNTNETISSIYSGINYCGLITSDSRVFMWGRNDYGQLGNGTTTAWDVANPTPIDITNQFSLNAGETLVSLSLGYKHTLALTSDGRIFSWGDNESGELGDGTTINQNTPIDITSNFSLDDHETITKSAVGDYFSLAITSFGKVYVWGYNSDGEIGDQTTDERDIPTMTSFAYVYSNETNLEYGQSLSDIVPTRVGYTFDGWYTDSELTTAYTFSTMPAEDMTLYGRWIPNQ